MSNEPSSGDSGSVPSDRINPQQHLYPALEPRSADGFADTSVAEAAVDPNPAGQTPSIPKELAQLLAASIGQMQASGAKPGPMPGAHGVQPGTPTGGDLASLAAIMAGAHTVRQPLPRFRDELATLNYRQQPQYPQISPGSMHEPVAHGVRAAQGQLDLPAHDDEPMPIPSTWREKPHHDDDNSFMRQLGAAAVGLAAGLVVVIPAVLYLVGWIGPQRETKPGAVAALSTSRASEAARSAEYKTLKVRSIQPAAEYAADEANDATAEPAAGDPVAVTTASMTKMPAVDPNGHVEHILVQARQRIDGGDVKSARDLLAAERDPAPALIFALAETYDPNMLAAWGSRGVNADVQRARALYARALDHGYGRAMARLEALQ